VIGTSLLPPHAATHLAPETREKLQTVLRRTHDAIYWESAMRGQNFAREDDLDVPRFNRALWEGIMDRGQ